MSGPNVEAPDAAATGQALGQGKADDSIIGGAGSDRKALSRLQAIGALNGLGVYELADGALLVTRWGLCKTVPDARALALFLAQMGISA